MRGRQGRAARSYQRVSRLAHKPRDPCYGDSTTKPKGPIMTPNARRLDRLARYPDGSPFQTLHSAVYHLSPPLSVEMEDGTMTSVEYVVVSTTMTAVGSVTTSFA